MQRKSNEQNNLCIISIYFLFSVLIKRMVYQYPIKAVMIYWCWLEFVMQILRLINLGFISNYWNVHINLCESVQ